MGDGRKGSTVDAAVSLRNIGGGGADVHRQCLRTADLWVWARRGRQRLYFGCVVGLSWAQLVFFC